jgi:L-rhamnose mutarotase
MKRYCLACDLKDDPTLIAEYIEWHTKVWPEVLERLGAAGVLDMEIYSLGNRLFMIMEVADDFTFERKAAMDLADPVVQKWEAMMGRFQSVLPVSKDGKKWLPMERVFWLQGALAQ